MVEKSEGGGSSWYERPWFWRWGVASWMFLGMIGAIVVIGLAYSRAHQVILPLIIAIIVGVLLEPLVSFMVRHRFPRWLATLLTMLLILAFVFGVIALVVYGITTQAGAIEKQVEDGVETIKDWFDNLKLSDSVVNWIHETFEKIWPQIQNGIAHELTETVPGLVSFLVGAFIGFFILIFILSDDGTIRNWVAGHMGVPRERGQAILDEVVTSIRGYFRGNTIVATFDAILMVPPLLILRVPLVGPIALVTFVTCYIPSFGGYIGGAFAVFITIASRGLWAGLIILVYAILLHTVMQGPVQAVAYGKTLKMHPLVALLVTLFGAIFAGIAGAILAVPVTAVVIKVYALIAKTRTGEEGPIEGEGFASPPERPS